MKMAAPMEIAISCENIEAMISFYTEVVGCEFVNIIEMSPEQAQHIPLARSGFRVARLQTDNGERIKLLEPIGTRASVPITEEVMLREHAFYITFIVKDIRSLLKQLKDQQVPMIGGYEAFEFRPGFFLAFARDPEGNVIEFNEYTDLAGYRSVQD